MTSVDALLALLADLSNSRLTFAIINFLFLGWWWFGDKRGSGRRLLTKMFGERASETAADDDDPFEFALNLCKSNRKSTLAIINILAVCWCLGDDRHRGSITWFLAQTFDRVIDGLFTAIVLAKIQGTMKKNHDTIEAEREITNATKALDDKKRAVEEAVGQAETAGYNTREGRKAEYQLTALQKTIDEAKSVHAQRENCTKVDEARRELETRIEFAEIECAKGKATFDVDRVCRAIDQAVNNRELNEIDNELKRLSDIKKKWAQDETLRREPDLLRKLQNKLNKNEEHGKKMQRIFAENEEGLRVNFTLNRLVETSQKDQGRWPRLARKNSRERAAAREPVVLRRAASSSSSDQEETGAPREVELVMRTLAEDSLDQIFPTSAAQQILHLARERQSAHDDDFISIAELDPSGGDAAATPEFDQRERNGAAGAINAIATGDPGTPEREEWETAQWQKLRDQIINKVSAPYAVGHVAHDVGVGVCDARYAFGVTYESARNERNRRRVIDRINPKFRVILVHEDMLRRAYDAARKRKGSGPQAGIQLSDEYKRHRWENIKAMAELHYDEDGAKIKQRRLLMSDPGRLITLSVPGMTTGAVPSAFAPRAVAVTP